MHMYAVEPVLCHVSCAGLGAWVMRMTFSATVTLLCLGDRAYTNAAAAPQLKLFMFR